MVWWESRKWWKNFVSIFSVAVTHLMVKMLENKWINRDKAIEVVFLHNSPWNVFNVSPKILETSVTLLQRSYPQLESNAGKWEKKESVLFFSFSVPFFSGTWKIERIFHHFYSGIILIYVEFCKKIIFVYIFTIYSAEFSKWKSCPRTKKMRTQFLNHF